MVDRSRQKLLLRALSGERTERPPVWLMRQAGRYLPEYHRTRAAAGGMLGLCNSPEHAAEVTLQPIRRFGLDAAILFADLPQLAAALGQTLEYHEGEGPVLTPPIRSPEDVRRHLSLSCLHDRLAPIYGTVRRLSATLPPEVALIGYSGAPWTIATYMVEGRGGGASDHAAVRRWALGDPDGFQPLIDLVTEAATQFLERQIVAGAEAVQLFESWAGILPEPYFRRWCVEPVARIVQTLRSAHPGVPVIAFPRAAGLLYNGYAEATQAGCIGLDTTVPLSWARDAVQRRLGCCIPGSPTWLGTRRGRTGQRSGRLVSYATAKPHRPHQKRRLASRSDTSSSGTMVDQAKPGGRSVTDIAFHNIQPHGIANTVTDIMESGRHCCMTAIYFDVSSFGRSTPPSRSRSAVQTLPLSALQTARNPVLPRRVKCARDQSGRMVPCHGRPASAQARPAAREQSMR